MDKSRRKLLKIAALTTIIPVSDVLSSVASVGLPDAVSNSAFKYIYGNEKYSNEFYNFLVNVFHLYPEDKLHSLIQELSLQLPTDKKIYQSLQLRMPGIKPFLSELSFALPALKKQKSEMQVQTLELLDGNNAFEGYLEIGSSGRYVDALEEKLDINGERFFISEKAPKYSIEDIMDRGQIRKAGVNLSLNNYKTDILNSINTNSIELVTVYIGFHHCPVHLRSEFISSIRDIMAPGGRLILSDHDARDDKMLNMVALAHDVFNMGTNETWKYNSDELRNFYSLKTLNKIMIENGFKSDGRKLYQKGDPTLNALMVFRKA